jgi:hypothetical protein
LAGALSQYWGGLVPSAYNTATGIQALFSNTNGHDNTATGRQALYLNTTGYENTATGDQALGGNTNGSKNVALGFAAGVNLTTGNNNIDIGNSGVAGESQTIRIGGDTGLGPQTATYIAGISGQTASGGVAVYVNTNGKLGTLTSSARFKTDIKPMDKASEAILALKPVIFRYKQEIDSKGSPQFGLVAEDVEKVNPNLVARDAEGKIYTVRYDAVNAMLLNEFLKEHRRVEQQDRKLQEQEAIIVQQKKDFEAAISKLEATVTQQQKGMKAMTARLNEQAGQIQKVSAEIEMSKVTTNVVLNNP